MRGQSTNTPLDFSTHPSGPFGNTNETGTTEAKFCTSSRPSLSDENQRVSRLTDGENVETQNYNEAIDLCNQMYTDTLLSRQVQDEEANSWKQRGDALIKKRGPIIDSNKLTVDGHYVTMSRLCGYATTVTKLKGKIIKDTVMLSLMNVVMQSRYLEILIVMAIHHSTIVVVVSVDIQWYLAYILVLLVE